MSAEKFKEEGNTKFSKRDFDGAELDYSKAISLDPSNACYYCNRAAARLALGKNTKALEDCDKALEYDPKYSKAFYRRGVAHLNLGNIPEAQRDFEISQQNEPSKVTLEKLQTIKRIEALLERGKEALEKSDWETANSYYSTALNLSPGLVAAKLGLGEVLLGQKKYQEAATLAGQILQDHSNHSMALLQRANAFYYMGQVHAIAPFLTNILRLDPDNAEAFKLHKKSQAMKRAKEEGNEYFKEKNYDAALEAYNRALEVDPTNTNFNSALFYNVGLIHHSKNDNNAALKSLDQAIESNPEYTKAYKLRAQINTKLGNYQEAVRDYHEASSREPDNRELKNQLKEAQSKLKEAEKKDYYAIMELDKNASSRDIERQYKRLAMKYHPDKHATADEVTKNEMDKKFKDLGEAYAVLSDDKKRSRYDNGMDVNGQEMDFGDIFGSQFGRGGGGFGGFPFASAGGGGQFRGGFPPGFSVHFG